MNTEVLKVAGLTRSFGQGEQRTEVLKGISFTVYDGEFVAISGPSGCGKSTLLGIMGLLDSADSGNYFVDGLDVGTLRPSERSKMRGGRIGFVFQSFNLIDEISVLDNVALPLKYMGQSAEQRRHRALTCLENVGLAEKADLFPDQLSGGQQQRVSIARALAGDSGILLVDEPTGNLDSHNGDMVMALLQQLNQKGTTIVLVTHDARYADMAGRTILLKDGLVVPEPSTESQHVEVA